MMQFVLVDTSTPATADDAHGGPLTAATLQQIAAACEVQLDAHVSPEWGGNYRVRAGADSSDVAPGEIVCLVVDALPDAPGAVAYHSVDGADHPLVFAARGMCSSLTSGNGSLSGAISHELVETAVDQSCNAWVDNGNGTEYAQEACDPCESDIYEINGVAVSNFVLRSYFGPGAPAPWTYLGSQGNETSPGPLGLSPGGYYVKRPVDESSATQVTGDVRQARMTKVRHWSSRTWRRGARAT